MKKAQLKIQQMAFMLLAVTLFFILIGVFLLSVKLTDIREGRTELGQEEALLLASKIANSPEFSCGSSFGGSKISCIDEDKLMALKQNIGKYQITSSETFWGVETNIEIRKLYTENNQECSASNYPNCGIINLFSKQIKSEESNFVLLCRKSSGDNEVYDKCEIAKLMINYKKWE